MGVDFAASVHSMAGQDGRAGPLVASPPMEELWPNPTDDVDVAARYEADDRVRADGRPWVMLGMIASADGAVSVDGVSGALGGPADHAVFGALRGLADVIVVGAGTVRAEDYREPTVDDSTEARRLERGQAPAPRLAVVTGSLSLDPDARLFADGHRPRVFTAATAPHEARSRLGDRVELRVAGRDRVDPAAVVEDLARAGTGIVLVEGGPTLNGQFLAAGLVDELCLTVSPVLVGGSGHRIVTHPDEAPTPMTLDRVIKGDDLLLLRYVRG